MDLKQAENLAISLMIKHNIYQRGWKFEFGNYKRAFGKCSYRRKMITLSKHLVALNEVARVQNTILHEIAHALTQGHGHDGTWRAKAIELGCDGKRCYSLDSTVTTETKYIAICNGCNRVHKRFRTPQRDKSCGYCCSKYNPDFKLNYTLNLNYSQSVTL